MKKLHVIWVLLLLCAVPVSAQEVYRVDFVNPCTGEMESYSGSIDERGDTIYVTYSLFGQSREFNTDDPNWANEALDWMIGIIEQELDCGPSTVQTSFEPTTNTVMNSTVRTIQNDVFTMDLSMPDRRTPRTGGTGEVDSEGEEEDENEGEESGDGEKQYYRELNVGTGVRTYNYDGFSGTATNYGADYIGLLRIGETQIGVNVDGLGMRSGQNVTSTQTLWGLRFKKSNYDEQTRTRKTNKSTFSVIDAEFSDFGAAYTIVTSSKRVKTNGMVNTGFAMTISLQSFNDYATVVYNNGYVFAFMRSFYFNEQWSGSINGLLLGNLNINGTVFENSEQTEGQGLIGGTFGGTLHYNVFRGAGIQVSLSYTPSSYVYTYGEITQDSGSSFSSQNTETYERRGRHGASSLSFDVGFAYRF